MILVLMILASAIRILNEYERGVIFRLGRVRTVGGKPMAKGPGLIFLIPVVDKLVKVSLRTVTMDVPPQDVITRDNVSLKVNAVIYFRVMDSIKAIIEIENYLYATSQLSQTTLRSVCGQVELDTLLSKRDNINLQIQEILDKHTEPWGVKAVAVEVKAIDLPEEMRRAMAKQAEAERERRSKVIHAEGEYPGRGKIERRRRDHRGPSHGPAVALFAGPDGNRHGEKFHDHLSDTHRRDQAIFATGGESCDGES